MPFRWGKNWPAQAAHEEDMSALALEPAARPHAIEEVRPTPGEHSHPAPGEHSRPAPGEHSRPAPGEHSRPVPGERTSEEWLAALRASGPDQEAALADLHVLLLRAARTMLRRRPAALSHVRGEELADIATQAADDALTAVLAKLDTFRGASRFTTWAYKFALLEAGVRLRRRAWQGCEVLLEPDSWPTFSDPSSSAQDILERNELLQALKTAIDGALTEHQRIVFVALALNEVPIDVLAERLDTTRGALYKTLHDARQKLRRKLAAEGFGPDADTALTRREDRR